MTPIRKLCNWYFSKRALPYWYILAVDFMIVCMSGIFTYYLRYGGIELAQNFWKVILGMCLCLVLYIIFSAFFHTFRGVLRHSSFVDLQRIAYSMAATCLVMCGLHQLQWPCGLTRFVLTPRFEDCCVLFIIATMGMWILRISVKILHDIYRGNESSMKRVFIYGCMQGGISLAKSIASSENNYRLAGFITNDKSLSGSWMMGARVYLEGESIIETMQKKGATVLFVSPLQTDNFLSNTSLIDALINANIKIMMMPVAEEWDGKTNLTHTLLHEVEIEDLLPREKIEIDMEAIGTMLKGKRILITGAAGSIGSEMARQVAKYGPSELILLDQAETPMHDMRRYMDKNHANLHVWTIVGSISNAGHMEEIFLEHKPEYVFHAAAYKHVPMMEDNPAMAVQNNVFGTRVIADLAVKYGAKKFVMISTDKAVNPTNVMGCSKRICEIYCQALNSYQNTTQFITTRFGNVLGSNGSVIPIFKEQIRKGGPITVTHPDIIRYFMLISEACRLVLEAGTMGNGGEIFVFDMGKPVRIVDLAKRMIALSGAKSIEIKFTGLRDGEKLFEEVLCDGENDKPTCHPKIKVAAVREYPYDLALKNEKELYDISLSYDSMAIVKKMKEIVPEYKSRNSVYEQIDAEIEKKEVAE